MVALLSVLLLQASLPIDASSQSKAASISLRAKWTSTPTLLEATEFLVSFFAGCCIQAAQTHVRAGHELKVPQLKPP